MAEIQAARAEDFEKLGAFYLGKIIDTDEGAAGEDLLLYDSKHLTTHAVCVGMTGSGKTGLCIGLLEEALIDSVPAIAIDLKGDLANLLLNFPELSPRQFQPWIDPGEAARKGLDVPAFAAKTADLWREGIAKWGQDAGRIQRLRDSADFTIYTPGSSAGVGLSVLKSFNAPSQEVLEDSDLLRDRITATVSGLLTLAGVKADPVRSREHILLSNILDAGWRAGRNIDLPALIREIQQPPFEKIGIIDLESFFSSSDRFVLAMQLNNLLAAPGFASWMEGEPLDVQRLLWTPEGKPRMSILYIAHLTESERMFFVTLLLNEIIAWMRKQPGTSSLRSLLYMDEVFGYFPPTANPPAKKPMLTLLKQARAFGLGVVLATQNPVDLDYKGLSNAGTWLIGRLQTERDVARVLDGLEGAATAAGGTFDRRDMERTIAGLDKRVFLMNNIHENEPVLFRTRWVLSYLRGPLTRDHIRTLMQEKKARAEQALTEGFESGSQRAAAVKPLEGKPVVPASIPQGYLMPHERMLPEEHVLYKPSIAGGGRLHYVKSSQDIDHWKEITVLAPLGIDTMDEPWTGSMIISGKLDLDSEGDDTAAYGFLHGEAAQPKNYKTWKTTLKNFLYREHRLEMFECKELKMMSQPGETKGDFLIRLRDAAHEKRDIEVQKLRAKYGKKLESMQNKIFTARERVEREKSQYNQQKLQTVISIGSTLLGSMLGGRRGSSWTTAARGAGRAARDREDIKRSKEKLARLQKDLSMLQQQMEKDLTALKAELDVEAFELNQTELPPRKADITVTDVQLVWVPWFAGPDGSLRKAIMLQ